MVIHRIVTVWLSDRIGYEPICTLTLIGITVALDFKYIALAVNVLQVSLTLSTKTIYVRVYHLSLCPYVNLYLNIRIEYQYDIQYGNMVPIDLYNA